MVEGAEKPTPQLTLGDLDFLIEAYESQRARLAEGKHLDSFPFYIDPVYSKTGEPGLVEVKITSKTKTVTAPDGTSYTDLSAVEKGRFLQIDLNPLPRSVSRFAENIDQAGFFQKADLEFDRVTGFGRTLPNAGALPDTFFSSTTSPQTPVEKLFAPYFSTEYVRTCLYGSNPFTDFETFIQLLTEADEQTKKAIAAFTFYQLIGWTRNSSEKPAFDTSSLDAFSASMSTYFDNEIAPRLTGPTRDNKAYNDLAVYLRALPLLLVEIVCNKTLSETERSLFQDVLNGFYQHDYLAADQTPQLMSSDSSQSPAENTDMEKYSLSRALDNLVASNYRGLGDLVQFGTTEFDEEEFAEVPITASPTDTASPAEDSGIISDEPTASGGYLYDDQTTQDALTTAVGMLHGGDIQELSRQFLETHDHDKLPIEIPYVDFMKAIGGKELKKEWLRSVPDSETFWDALESRYGDSFAETLNQLTTPPLAGDEAKKVFDEFPFVLSVEAQTDPWLLNASQRHVFGDRSREFYYQIFTTNRDDLLVQTPSSLFSLYCQALQYHPEMIHQPSAWVLPDTITGQVLNNLYYNFALAFTESEEYESQTVAELWDTTVTSQSSRDISSQKILADFKSRSQPEELIRRLIDCFSNPPDISIFVDPFLPLDADIIYGLRHNRDDLVEKAINRINNEFLMPLGYAVICEKERGSYDVVPVRLTRTAGTKDFLNLDATNIPEIIGDEKADLIRNASLFTLSLDFDEFPRTDEAWGAWDYIQSKYGLKDQREFFVIPHANPHEFFEAADSRSYFGPKISESYVNRFSVAILNQRNAVLSGTRSSPLVALAQSIHNMDQSDTAGALKSGAAAHETAHLYAEALGIEGSVLEDGQVTNDEIFASLIGISQSTNPRAILFHYGHGFFERSDEVKIARSADKPGYFVTQTAHGKGMCAFYLFLARERGLIGDEESLQAAYTKDPQQFDSAMKEVIAQIAAWDTETVQSKALDYALAYASKRTGRTITTHQ